MDLPSLVIQQIISKIVVDGTRIPRSAYSKVEPLVEEFKKWGRTFEDFETDKPETWVRSGLKLMENLVEKDVRRTDPIEAYLHDNKFETSVPDSMGWVGQFLLEKCELSIVAESGEKRLCKIQLNPKTHVFVTIVGSQYEFDDIYFPDDDEERKTSYKGIRDLFWSYNDTVIIDDDEDEFIVKQYIFPDRAYQGDLINEISNLKKFMEAGVRRVMVFQGIPGTGKSTLCANASKLLSKRTVVLSNTILMHLSRNDWEEILKLLEPEMVVIDDIDRTNMRSLETSLYLFEDTYYNVPLTLLTTNDQRKLPDAFRRPGRIDQIIEMPNPTAEIRRNIIKEMAEREGLDGVPEDKAVFFDELIKERPVAYLVELMRRYKVLGWDYEVPANDIVFYPILEEINDPSSCTHEVLDGGCPSVFEAIGPEDDFDDEEWGPGDN